MSVAPAPAPARAPSPRARRSTVARASALVHLARFTNTTTSTTRSSPKSPSLDSPCTKMTSSAEARSASVSGACSTARDR